jgi:undecaprenyl phosphate-alpha-L-ara4N flippase subunit ArnE
MLRAASILAHAADYSGPSAWINGTSLAALAIYGLAMLLWLWVLGRVPLTQAFAFFGLSFFIVPALAHRFLGDAVSGSTWIGAGIIAVGIVVTNWRAA